MAAGTSPSRPQGLCCLWFPSDFLWTYSLIRSLFHYFEMGGGMLHLCAGIWKGNGLKGKPLCEGI